MGYIQKNLMKDEKVVYEARQHSIVYLGPIFKRGIINRRSFELLLRKCEGIQVNQTILGRIFDYGTVNVTTGEATNSYKYISHPLTFSTKIHEQIHGLRDDC